MDAVIISVHLSAHFAVTKDALQSGKNVFCEKCLVFRPEEVIALRELYKNHPKQVLQVGLQRRYSKMYQMAKEIVDKGLIGDVTHIHAQWHRNPGWVMKGDASKVGKYLANWRMYREYSGGLAAEIASHQDRCAWPMNYILLVQLRDIRDGASAVSITITMAAISTTTSS